MKHPTKRLIHDASFSPSLISSVVEHKKQIKRDQKLRMAALVFMLLTVATNVLLFISPPENSLTSSNNDLINGGLTHEENRAKEVLVQALENDRNPGGNQDLELRALYQHYGIESDDVQRAKEVDICVSCDPRLYIVNRNENVAESNTDEITISGITYFEEPLSVFKNNQSLSDTLPALEIRKGTYVLYDSGNIVFQKIAEPKLLITPKTTDGPTVISEDGKRVDATKHEFVITNDGEASAQFIQFEAELDSGVEVIDYSVGSKASSRVLEQQEKSTLVKVEFDRLTLEESHKIEIITTGTDKKVCLEARASALNAEATKSSTCSNQPRDGNDSDVEIRVEAMNTRTGLEASASDAKPGDVISYRIQATNTGQRSVESYELPSTDVSDIEEYASVAPDANGSIVDEAIQWSIFDLQPDQTVERSFTATVDSEISSTTQSASNASSFDCQMRSIIGSTVTIVGLDCGVTKDVEQSVSSLPYISSFVILGLLAATAGLAALMYTEHNHLFARLEFIHNQHGYRR